jgi:hypothetical protein
MVVNNSDGCFAVMTSVEGFEKEAAGRIFQGGSHSYSYISFQGSAAHEFACAMVGLVFPGPESPAVTDRDYWCQVLGAFPGPPELLHEFVAEIRSVGPEHGETSR